MASSESEDYDSDTEPIDSEEEEEDGSDADDGMCEFDDGDGGSDQQVYAALSNADIRRLMEDDLDQVSSILSLSCSWSSILLRIYSWNVYRACESWLAGKDRILEALGPSSSASEEIPDSDELYCGICLENRPSVTMSASACSHYFCDECWKGYIGTSIADGAGCLMLRCPQPSCPVLIHPDMIDSLANEGQKEKYSNYLVRSYVEQGKKKSIKWCPSPDCEYAVQFDPCRRGGKVAADVRCNCSYSFCWNCTEEAHRPVDCATVANWIIKNTSEAENTNWILANTKLCPKCRKPIEKNQGCMHMTCRPPCRHEFCWTCLGNWTEHGDYSCNSYRTRNRERETTEEGRIREMAKLSIEKYSHYYERWAGNHKSMRIALESMSALPVDDLREKLGENAIQMEFINSAWLQIVECRRVLKWTYAYGYYLPEDDPAKKRFFEYLQGEAEAGLERLHGCAEKELEELERFIDAKDAAPSEEFSDFKEKLTGLTTVTKTYFDNLVRALEGGLMDVDSIS